jgi:hypothetical protein
MKCKLCETRRPRRYCPGVTGDICSICCGTEREQTVNCPLDCEYLIEARSHEKPVEPVQLANADVEITGDWLQEHQALIYYLYLTLAQAFDVVPDAFDSDFREAIDSLTTTYRTAQSGLLYESLPNNPIAANIHRFAQSRLQEFRETLAQRHGMRSLREVEVFGALVYMQRTAAMLNNGRRRGRAFVQHTLEFAGHMLQNPEPPSSSNLVLP